MEKMDHNAHSVYLLYYHLVMVVKYRRKIIDEQISDRAKEIFEYIAPNYGIVYGKETLNENLKFIADTLGGRGNPKDVIRSYFLNDFYTDHSRMYQKCPIYWQFDSGKKNGC